MPRTKVAPEARIRSVKACESCKRRKQKCDGRQPCAGCTKRASTCIFAQHTPRTPAAPSSSATQLNKTFHNKQHSEDLLTPVQRREFSQIPQAIDYTQEPNVVDLTTPRDTKPDDVEEAVIQESSRMLEDGKGRMLYIGDSASLSYLQLLRRLIERAVGSSSFTVDPHRHKILEASLSIQPSFQHTYAFPDYEAATYLVDCFFSSTKGFIFVFDPGAFKQRMNETYKNPLSAEPSWLCLLNLVFANGLQMRKTVSDASNEAKILERLTRDNPERSEIFFLNAKHLNDPVTGLEDGGFGSIQALILMTHYMLTAAKRNAAWAYFGMATRLAFALGLHRQETQRAFGLQEQITRRNVWRTLYIMDRFLSSSLGRPLAINDSCCDDIALNDSRAEDSVEGSALIACFRSSKLIGDVLDRVYHQRRISSDLAYKLVTPFHSWIKSLDPRLSWQKMLLSYQDPDTALTKLHVNLMYFHGIILLTRPLFLWRITLQCEERRTGAEMEELPRIDRPNIDDTTLVKFSGACLRSALHSIACAQSTLLQGCLPRRDPFAIYWIFSAALIVYSNAICDSLPASENDSAAQTAFNLLEYCSESDKQAKRYLNIIASLQETVTKIRAKTTSVLPRESRDDLFENLFGEDIPTQLQGSGQSYQSFSFGPSEMAGMGMAQAGPENASYGSMDNNADPWSAPGQFIDFDFLDQQGLDPQVSLYGTTGFT